MRAALPWALLFGGAALLGAAALAPSAFAFATPGGTGDLTLDTLGAPPTVVWKVSALPLAYQLNETLVVSVGDTLRIPAGASIAFWNGTELRVLGGLEVQGTPTAPVSMGVVPDSGGMAVSWGGILAFGAAVFAIQGAVLTDSVDLMFANGTGAMILDVSYEGRLFFDNASDIAVENVTMDLTPTDVGRVALWVENSRNVTVVRADLRGGTGWGGAAVILENSQDVTVVSLTVRDDNQNLVGLQVILSRRVRVDGYTFTQGPTGGDPNQALDLRDSDGVWVERLDMTHVGQSGLGAIYGVRSNATIANSTFAPGISQGVWQFAGTLTGLNATRLPVRPEAGATVREFELAKVEARWTASGKVRAGNATLENESWAVSAPISGGETPWLWLLREVNASGNVSRSEGYTAQVTCNCTGASAAFTLSDEWGVLVVVFVGDALAPVAVPALSGGGARTGQPVNLDGSASIDNAAVAAYAWAVVGAANATGLPCATALCAVTFNEPGNFTVELTVTDTGGNTDRRRLTVSVADATAPRVEVVGRSVDRPGEGEPFQVQATAEDNDPAFLPEVYWYVDGAEVAGGTLSPTLIIQGIGRHTLRVVVMDDAGNEAEAQFQVEVRDSTAPQVGVWTPPAGLVAPVTLQLKGSVASDNVAVTSWRWLVSGPGALYNLTGELPNATFPSPGTYNITLAVEDAEGNRASRTFEVAIAGSSGVDEGLPVGLIVGLSAVGAVAVAAVALRPKRPKEPETGGKTR